MAEIQGIRQWLAELPGGRQGKALKWEQVGAWIKKTALGREAKAERRRAKRRHEFYMSGGDGHMNARITGIFKDKQVAAKRRDWIEMAKINNVWRRFVNERATVYSVPADRQVQGEKNQENYLEVMRLCRLHAMSQRWNRWGTLHRNLAIGARVRQGRGSRPSLPIVDIVAPDAFFTIHSPLDPTELLALGIKIGAKGPSIDEEPPAWEVWTDHERFFLTNSGLVRDPVVHGFRRMPWALFSIEPPSGKLVDSSTGREVDAAHMAVWFLHILLLKEAKSATKIPVIAGDLTRTARSQAADSEVPVEVKDGTTVSAVDMSMDLELFKGTASVIYETAAANYGIPPNILKHQGVQSAEARELMRAPLKELRRDQEIYLREFEREFADILSMVVARDLSELSFSTDGWFIDFKEGGTPLDPKKELEVFEHARKLGVTNTFDFVRGRNPDMTLKQAIEFVKVNIQAETKRNELLRPLQRISGSAAAPVGPEDGKSDDGSPPVEKSDAGLRAIPGGSE